jgi:hypothetical protein
MFWYTSSNAKEAQMYLGWYDPDKKKKTARKLAEAVERYTEKYGKSPAVVLVNEADAMDYPDIEVRVVGHVAPNTFFVGEDEPEVASPLAA